MHFVWGSAGGGGANFFLLLNVVFWFVGLFLFLCFFVFCFLFCFFLFCFVLLITPICMYFTYMLYYTELQSLPDYVLDRCNVIPI